MRSLINWKEKGVKKKKEGKKAEKIKHMLNSIKTAIMALVVRPEDSFV